MRPVLPLALLFAAALPTTAQNVATFDQRAQIVLNSIPATAAGIESGHHIQYQIWASESLYLKGIDSEAKTLLLQALPQMHEPATPDDDAFNLIAAVDVMERWSSHFTPTPDPDPSQNLNTVYQATLTGFPYWNSASTSNQLVMAAVARYLSYERYPTATFTSNFATNDPNGRTFLLCYMAQVVTHSLQEYDSDVYTGAYLWSFRLLADYAQDPAIKQAAQLTYDWLLTNSASTWLNSTWAATSYRRYLDIAPQNQMETGSWTFWPLFGGPAPGSGFNVELMQGALQTISTCQCATGYAKEDGTAFQPRQEIMDLLAWSTAPNPPASYEFKARTYTPSRTTYQYMQDSYITPNYALFGEANFETSSGTKIALQGPAQILSGVVWNPSAAKAGFPSNFYSGAPRWQVDLVPTTPVGCPNTSTDCAVANHTFAFGQHGQYFQNGNAQLGVYNYNITTLEPETDQFYIYAPLCTNNQYPYSFASSTTIPNFPCTTATVPHALLTTETATLGHLYLFYDNVLISLWLSAPFSWDGFHELTAYDPATLNSHSLLASAIEVASPASFAGSTDAATLANFAAYVDSHAKFDTSGLTGTSPYAVYTTSNGAIMQNTFQGQNLLNGATVAYANWPLMQTPWVQQNWLSTVACVSCYAGESFSYPTVGGGGNLTVTSPVTGNELVYNFSDETVTELLFQTVNFTAAPTPAPVGSKATLTAMASSGLPVTFSVSGNATISGSAVTYTGSGTVTLTATQVGNASYLPATATQTITVVDNTSTTVTYTPAAPTFGSSVTLTATITPSAGTATPTGSVSFYDNGTFLGSNSLTAGATIFSTSTLAVGAHPITAVYIGDSNYATSTSAPVTINVTAAPTTLTITAAPTTATFGTSITFTTKLIPISAVYSGEAITFLEDATTLGAGKLDATGTATFNTAALPLGPHNISASYTGDADFLASTTSAPAAVTISPIATTVTLTAAPTTGALGTSIRLAVTVVPASGSADPDGTVTLLNGIATLGTATLNASGQATFSTTTLAVGTHTITATYTASGNFATSPASAPVTVTIIPAADYSIAAAPTTITVPIGSSSTSTITVTPLNTYTGSVTFSCGTGLPNSVVCAVTPTTLSFLPATQTPQTTTLTLTVGATNRASLRSTGLVLAFLGLPFALFNFTKRRKQSWLPALICFTALTTLSGCATSNISTGPHGSYGTTVTSTDGANVHTFALNVTIP